MKVDTESLANGGRRTGAALGVVIPALTFFSSFPPPLFPAISLITSALYRSDPPSSSGLETETRSCSISNAPRRHTGRHIHRSLDSTSNCLRSAPSIHNGTHASIGRAPADRIRPI